MKKMNKYVTPEIEVIMIEAEDVCTISAQETGDVTSKSWTQIWEA